MKLTKEECEASYKLAAALSNYDKDDYRILKFLDIKVKDSGKIVEKEEIPNFIEINKKKLVEHADEIKKFKEEVGVMKKKTKN